jgi:hypothetical protein
MNALINLVQSRRHEPLLHLEWTRDDIPRCTIQPQTANFWKGMTVVGCSRGRGPLKKVMNGVFYDILGFDSANVQLRMHASCVGSESTAAEPFSLSHEHFLLGLRLTHALPYNYFQGRTLKGQKLMLMDLRSPRFTMRHLIMGMGRVTKGEDLWLCGPRLQKDLQLRAKAVLMGAEQGVSFTTQAQLDEAAAEVVAEVEAEDLADGTGIELLESDDEDEPPLNVPEVDDDLFE